MTEKMKTVCVGRFLVDVPAQAEITLSHEMISGFEIETEDESEEVFRERIAAREHVLAQADGTGDKGGRRLVEARDVRIPDMVGRTFIYDLSRGYLMDGDRRMEMESVSVETHVHIRGMSVSLSAKYTDEGSAREAEAILARIRPRDGNEIPVEPGFCSWRVLFAEPLPPHKTEHVVLHIGFTDHPEIALTLASMPGGGTDPDLLVRAANTDAESSPEELLRVSKLRSGKRSVNGLAGEELLERIRELNFATTYSFMWEVKGVDADPMQPFLSLELQGGISPRPGGKPVDTSLHEDAVLALWDSISSSIRLRPSGPPPGPLPDPEPPTPQLGAMARAGEVCPHSGWWLCNDGRPGVDVQGGAVQYIRKGERMPQALLLPHRSMWQRVRGLQPSIEPSEPSVWKLVDKRHRPRTPAIVALAPAIPSDGSRGEQASGLHSAEVGVHVRTGELCPASGWWRCEEAQALDGARWFPRGSALPAATFLLPRGLFGRTPGPEVIQRRSIWRLMRHAEAEHVASTFSTLSGRLDEAPAATDGPTSLT